MRVMGLLMPKPSEVEATFKGLLAHNGPKEATDWFYRTAATLATYAALPLPGTSAGTRKRTGGRWR